jgi:hypothetical protein
MALAQHSRAFDGWETPPEIVAVARALLGEFLDPCTYAHNPTGARIWFTREDDALSRDEWPDLPVFCNPPGGLVRQFWRRCVAHAYDARPVFWVGFNLNQLAYLDPSPLYYQTTILRKRVRYWRDGKLGGNPTHHSYLTLLGRQSGLESLLEKAGLR